MLMAAGLGTRLKPFTDVEPKALLPLMGIPMAQFALDALTRAGVRKVVANVHHHAERAKTAFHALDRGSAELVLSDESDLLLGSAGGLRKALPALGEKAFFLVNADVLCDVDLAALARAHAKRRERFGALLTLTVFPAGPAGGGYREILFDPVLGRMTGLGTELSVGRPYFVGAAVIEPEALSGVPAGAPAEFVPTILEPAVRADRVGVYLSEGVWHDIGSPLLWLNAHMSLMQALETRRSPLWSDRIEKMNKRVGPGLWVSRDAPSNIRFSAWAAPAYWNPLRDETAHIPENFGPEAVLYGAAPGRTALSRGIGFRGLWTSGV